MKTRLLEAAALGVAVLCASAASPAPDWETLVRQGDTAFGGGDYAAAAALYEQAEERSTDPGRVAMDLGAAKYRLALASDADRARLAREAEEAFRSCTDAGDPRRPQALYGLGDALLLKANGRDADSLKAAVVAYLQCLSEAPPDAALADDARHNLERARLLLRQVTPAAGRPQTEPRGDGPPKPQSPDRPPGTSQNPAHDPHGAKVKPDPDGAPAKPEEGPKPVETPDQAPGEGNLPPVPDRADLPPLSADDAGRHLDLAAQRILQDLKAHRRAKAPAPPTNVPDW